MNQVNLIVILKAQLVILMDLHTHILFLMIARMKDESKNNRITEITYLKKGKRT